MVFDREGSDALLVALERIRKRAPREAAAVARELGIAAKDATLAPAQERALVHQTLDEHYRRVMDEPIPALGGKSPRAAVKTPKGQENVAAWLKTLANHGAHRPPDDPMGSYDVGWMWEELGVQALRR
jgi:hypothetical protein